MAKADNGDYTLSVKVANVGGAAGKSSVQFYMSAPYIPGSGVERAAVELVEFEKTDILEPGADETLTVTVPKEYLKVYNTDGEGGYVVQGGDYYFTAAFNAHDAVNDILAAKEGESELSANPLAQKDAVAEDTETYKVSTQTGCPVKNQFGFADLNNIGYEITYLTRSDWTGTFPTTQELAVNQTIVDQEKYWEAADVPVDGAAQMPTLGGDGDVTAVQLMGKAYDDPMWEELLDRISFDEMQYFLRVGGYRTSAIPSIAFNTIGGQDGPAGISATLIGGGTWTGASKELLTEVLRSEWGFVGRVLYSAINSAGMNGTSADTRVVQLVPTWRALLWTGTAVISAGIVMCRKYGVRRASADKKERRFISAVSTFNKQLTFILRGETSKLSRSGRLLS